MKVLASVIVSLPVISGTVRTAQSFVAPSFSTARANTVRLFARAKYNPFSSMLGDVGASLLGGNKGASPSNPSIDAALSSILKGSSFGDVRSKLESMETKEEQAFRENLVKGYGVGSPMHKIRLYDESNKEEDVRVTFYRDSASWCPYCQKVWLLLEEKRIPYRIEKVNMRCYGDKPPEFMRLQPSGNIPVAIIDGQVYGQSNDIMYALESLFPDHKSLRAPKGQEMKAQELLRLERQLFSAWMYWLTGGDYQSTFVASLKEVEAALVQSGGPYFMGNSVTIVDCMFTPFLERMAASLPFYKGFMMRVPKGTKTDYPALNKWFDAMETLESYQLTKSDYYTHNWDLPPQLGGCTYEPAGEPFERAINGERALDGTQGSWELPLQPHNGGVEPDWDWANKDEAAAKREAVERLSFNHEAITKFAARGAGRKGVPPFSAVLADPNAVPNDNVQTGVSAVLQTICLALLEGTDKHSPVMKKLAAAIAKEGGKEYAEGIVSSLVYLRDRVGVQRDMKLTAARQLRAHLNWAIGTILDAQTEGN